MSDGVELSAPPEEIIGDLTIALTETGQRYTVSTDRLADDGVLVVVGDPDTDENTVLAPEKLYDRLYVEGMYYVPEYSPAWEVDEALSQLAGGCDE